MKKHFLLSLLCGLVLSAAFVSCSDNDDPEWKKGSTVDLPKYRSFVLTEGTYGGNNSHLFFMNPATDQIEGSDLFEAQNSGRKIGDTANDMITYDGNIYVVVNYSKVLLKLSGAGVELSRYSDFDELGEPRNLVEANGKLYVTCYGGYVARFNAKDLQLEAKVKVDANPEQIIAYGGKLYCVNSGYGKGKTLSIIDIKTFNQSESVETLANPYGIQESNGHIYISAYGADYSNPVGVYDPVSKQTTTIGNAGRVFADGDNLYMANSVATDFTYTNYATTYSIYNAKANTTTTWNLNNIPETMKTGGAVVYFITKNPFDNTYFIGMTNYYSNGTVYHIAANGSYISTIDVPALNPNGMVFLNK